MRSATAAQRLWRAAVALNRAACKRPLGRRSRNIDNQLRSKKGPARPFFFGHLRPAKAAASSVHFASQRTSLLRNTGAAACSMAALLVASTKIVVPPSDAPPTVWL